MSNAAELAVVWILFLVAVGFRLAALRVPQAQRRRVVRTALQITAAAAALGLGIGLITPLSPAIGLLGVAVVGATTAAGLILVNGSSQPPQRPTQRPSFARMGGRLAGIGTARATAVTTGALRDLLKQFEQEFGSWAEYQPGPEQRGPKTHGTRRPRDSGRSDRPAQPAAPVGSDPYRVLGVTRTDGSQAVRKRYIELVKRDHPDNYSASADQAMQRTRAEANLKIITEAYRLIRTEQGWA